MGKQVYIRETPGSTTGFFSSVAQHMGQVLARWQKT